MLPNEFEPEAFVEPARRIPDLDVKPNLEPCHVCAGENRLQQVRSNSLTSKRCDQSEVHHSNFIFQPGEIQTANRPPLPSDEMKLPCGKSQRVGLRL